MYKKSHDMMFFNPKMGVTKSNCVVICNWSYYRICITIELKNYNFSKKRNKKRSFLFKTISFDNSKHSSRLMSNSQLKLQNFTNNKSKWVPQKFETFVLSVHFLVKLVRKTLVETQWRAISKFNSQDFSTTLFN